MARTYTNTPEPRYVEKAKTVEGGGGGGGPYIVNTHESEDTFYLVLEKKWSEIYAAYETQPVIIIQKTVSGSNEYINIYQLMGIIKETGNYSVIGYGGSGTPGPLTFTCSTENDYPQAEID